MCKSSAVIQWRCSPHVLCVCSVLIFFSFFPGRSLSCQRITLHKNLFFSFILNSIITIIWLTAVASNQELVQRNPVSVASGTVQFVLICDWNQFFCSKEKSELIIRFDRIYGEQMWSVFIWFWSDWWHEIGRVYHQMIGFIQMDLIWFV